MKAAHPRSRGENLSAGICDILPGGSSPLTRGKPLDERPSFGETGLIPAHAGKTPSPLPRLSLAGAHPRSRGENLARLDTGIGELGSSPLTRGKQDPYYDALDATRLIPAHAGKTQEVLL